MGCVPEVTSGTVHLGHEAAAKPRPGGCGGHTAPPLHGGDAGAGSSVSGTETKQGSIDLSAAEELL